MSNVNDCCGGACAPTTMNEAPGKEVSYFRPDVDVIERSDAFVVTADLPGVKPDSISIEFDKGTLTLTASVQTRANQRPLVQEYAVGDYRRVFRIGESINSEAIDADYSHGVLTITLPKAAEARSRKIEVRAN